jgi:uncharacterized protein YoaH (UPF0181 family)
MAGIQHSTLVTAWRRLEKTLVEANKHYYMCKNGGRAAAFRQLGGVNQFIKAVAPDRTLLQIPLLALHLALHYLDHGVVEPMVSPTRSGRGRPLGPAIIKVRSAIAMSQLYNIGYSRGEAAKLVARELARLGHKATAGAVADWRDELSRLPPGSKRADEYKAILGAEVELTGRGPGRRPIQEPEAGAKEGRSILELLRKFVVLSHLTANPDLSSFLPKLNFRPRPAQARKS